jgi:hypothetical protein
MRKIWVAVLWVLSLTMILGINVWAASNEFSADLTITDAKGKVTTGKIFVKGEKLRQEVTAEGGTGITILRLDKKVSWTLLSDNQYMEIAFPFDPKNPEQSTDIKYEKTIIGNETVNGYDCQVVQYTYKEKKYGIVVQWVANKYQFAVRTESKDAKGKLIGTTDYTNIKASRQPDSLFEVPAGYQKMTVPFKLPGFGK